MHNTSERSTILLVIIGIDGQPEQLVSLGLPLLEELFEHFGVLRKILIFQKEVVVKAFLEFSTPEESSEARSFFHDCQLNACGKTKVFFSALQKLEFSGRVVESKDFRTPNKTSALRAPKPKRQTVVSESNSGKKAPIVLRRQERVLAVLPKRTLAENIDFNNKPDKENIANQAVSTLPKITAIVASKAVEPKSLLVTQTEWEAPTDSKVVLISNLDDFFTSVDQIFNVFSCFGNIAKILFMKNLKKALVEYKKRVSGEAAVSGLNNCPFGKTKIKVAFSKFQKIDLKRNNKSENSQNFNEVMIVSGSMNRFKNNAAEDIQPTDTLVGRVARTDQLPLSNVFLAVQLFARPLRTKTVEETMEEGESEQHEVLFRFANVQEAMKVLAQAHNSQINGQLLSLNFTARRI